MSQRMLISSDYSNRLVHGWRSEEAAILVGTNTALCDDPELTNRLWNGPSPTRLVLDMDLRLPATLKIFNGKFPTIIFNGLKEGEFDGVRYYRLDKNSEVISQLLSALFKLKMQSVLVEGGRKLLQSFIDARLWDEARVITGQPVKKELNKPIQEPVTAPFLTNAFQQNVYNNGNDHITIYERSGENGLHPSLLQPA